MDRRKIQIENDEARQFPAFVDDAFKERQSFSAIFQNEQVIGDLLVRESLPQKIDIARIILNHYNSYGPVWTNFETICPGARPFGCLLFAWTAVSLAVETMTRDDHFFVPVQLEARILAFAASPPSGDSAALKSS